MYKQAILVFREYSPRKLKKGMYFQTMSEEGVPQIYELGETTKDKDSFIKEHGYPVEPYIISADTKNPHVLANSQQIGMFDAQISYSTPHPIGTLELNEILSHHDGWIAVDTDESGKPLLKRGKVTVAYPVYEEVELNNYVYEKL